MTRPNTIKKMVNIFPSGESGFTSEKPTVPNVMMVIYKASKKL